MITRSAWSAYTHLDEEKSFDPEGVPLPFGPEEGAEEVDSSRLQNLFKLVEKTNLYQSSESWDAFKKMVDGMVDGPEGLLSKASMYAPGLYENMALFNRPFKIFCDFKKRGMYGKFRFFSTPTEKKLTQLFSDIQKTLICIDKRVDSEKRGALKAYLQMPSRNVEPHFHVIIDLLEQSPKLEKNLQSAWKKDRLELVQEMFRKWAYFGLEPQVLAFVRENRLESGLKQATQKHLETFFDTSLKEFSEYLSKVGAAKILTGREIQVWESKKSAESRSIAVAMLAFVAMAVFTVYLRQLIRE